MTIAEWTSVQERSRNYAILLQDLMTKGCLQAFSGDALRLVVHTYLSNSTHPSLHQNDHISKLVVGILLYLG